MAWIDRLIEAAYTAPDGTRQTFSYTDVSQQVERKTTGFDFPDADGTYVQDLGKSGRRYPLRLIFWGDDYDTDADAFDGLLTQQGVGKLEHPVYGTVDVVPFGAITRRDDLATAANQAVIEVTFWETIPLVYPTSEFSPTSAVISVLSDFKTAIAAEFAGVVDLTGAVEQAIFENEYIALLNSTVSTVTDIIETAEDVERQFNLTVDSITSSIDSLLDDAETLAEQTIQATQIPAFADSASISDRVGAYGAEITTIISGEVSDNNQFRNKDLYGMGHVTGTILSAVNNQFTTKTEALTVAEQILDQFDELVAWRDETLVELSEIDQGAAYQQLQESVATAIGYLVEISFSLKQERRVVLTRNRTIIDLTAELYGVVDEELDFFISSNELTGSEILEIPKGREIVYYV